MSFYCKNILPVFFVMMVYSVSAQSSFQKFNHALISHLNEQVVFLEEEIKNGISGEMLLILVADSGRVSDVILKKGLTASINDEISRACRGFMLPDAPVGNRFTIMLFVDSRLKRISPLL